MDIVEKRLLSAPPTPMIQWKYESLRAVLEPAMSLSMVESRTLSALMSDSDMGLKITKQCLRLFASYVIISLRTDHLWSMHRCIWIIKLEVAFNEHTDTVTTNTYLIILKPCRQKKYSIILYFYSVQETCDASLLDRCAPETHWAHIFGTHFAIDRVPQASLTCVYLL